MQLAYLQASAPPPTLEGAPKVLRSLHSALLAKRPEARPDTAIEVARALEAAPVAAQPLQ